MRQPTPSIVAPLLAIVIALAASSLANAQSLGRGLPAPAGKPGNIHRLYSGDMPPGIVGSARLQRWGFSGGYFQPVALGGPQSAQFSLASDGGFLPPTSGRLHAGLLIGAVYRFRISSIPGFEGEELYPTVEVIDRTYPPGHLANRFAIPINLDQEDLEDALAGRFVTRVVYLEDPTQAVPIAETPQSSRALDIPANQDALAVADTLGKPVAIVRIGSVTPPTSDVLLPQFFFGYPPWNPIEESAVVEPSAGQQSTTTDLPLRDENPPAYRVGDSPRLTPTN